MTEATLQQFSLAYAEHRKSEGRGYRGQALLDLPYVQSGPHISQWKIRARTFEAFIARVLRPMARQSDGPLTVLDLGAGNGWLSHRIAVEGHRAIALDIRTDCVDGLGAAAPFLVRSASVQPMAASFDAIPLACASVDIAVFNAALHYTTDLPSVLQEAGRVTKPGAKIVIMDSPFYPREADGLAMVAEKRAALAEGPAILIALPFIEFLTRERLRSAAPELEWTRERVRYPLAYEIRPMVAAITGRRRPSRFDLWVAKRP